MSATQHCPKCQASMREGWIPEATSRNLVSPYTVPVADYTAWMPGAPVLNAKGEVKWEQGMESNAIPITVLRCEECGSLNPTREP